MLWMHQATHFSGECWKIFRMFSLLLLVMHNALLQHKRSCYSNVFNIINYGSTHTLDGESEHLHWSSCIMSCTPRGCSWEQLSSCTCSERAGDESYCSLSVHVLNGHRCAVLSIVLIWLAKNRNQWLSHIARGVCVNTKDIEENAWLNHYVRIALVTSDFCCSQYIVQWYGIILAGDAWVAL